MNLPRAPARPRLAAFVTVTLTNLLLATTEAGELHNPTFRNRHIPHCEISNAHDAATQISDQEYQLEFLPFAKQPASPSGHRIANRMGTRAAIIPDPSAFLQLRNLPTLIGLFRNPSMLIAVY